MNDVWRNWAGLVHGTPAERAAPCGEAEIQDAVNAATSRGAKIAVVGSGHSFAPLVDAEGRTLLSLAGHSGVDSVDREAMTATVRGGTRLDRLNEELAAQGLSLPNQTAIAEQTIAGCVATASHGGGGRYGSLSEHVVGARIVRADGEVAVVGEGDPELDAVRSHLGCLGVVSTLTVRVVPAFSVRKVVVRRGLPEALRDLDWLRGRDFGGLYWYPHTERVVMWWADQTGQPADLTEPAPGRAPSHRLLRTSMAPVPIARTVNHLLARMAGGGVCNLRSDRAFVQPLAPRQQVLEYGVPAEIAADAIRDFTSMVTGRRLRVAAPVEMRFTGADTAWLSPAYRRPTLYVNLACYLSGRGSTDWETPMRAADTLFATEYEGRSHWAKVHWRTAGQLAARYPRWDDFRALRRSWDPGDTFASGYLLRMLDAQTAGSRT